MALPLGKLTIIVGAGLVGSVLAKEGRLSNVSDVVSGAFKIVLRQIRSDDSSTSISKPRNDTLLAQVNSLRQELQVLASNRSITIVSSGGAGANKYGAIIVIVVVGSGYVWWKGWKLPDMMFATKRGLSDACNSVARHFEDVYSSLSDAQKQLSSKITTVNRDVNKIIHISEATKEEVIQLKGRSKKIDEECQTVHDTVQILESKLSEIELKQNETMMLCDRLWRKEKNSKTERIQVLQYSSSMAALESPSITPTSRTASLPPPLPPPLPLEPPSPSTSNGSQKIERPLHNTVSASGLKDLYGVSDTSESSTTPNVSNGFQALEDSSGRNSGIGLFGHRRGASVLTRQRSATNPIRVQAESNSILN